MAPFPRQRDYLESVAQTQRRVSALETGAHPLGASLDFGASWPLTVLPTVSAIMDTEYMEGSTSRKVRYIKRLSTVQMSGYWLGQLGMIDADGEHVGTLNSQCTPPFDRHYSVALDRSPWFTGVTVKDDGQIWMYNTNGVPNDGTVYQVYSDMIQFIAELP